jgi:hypothetical protein
MSSEHLSPPQDSNGFVLCSNERPAVSVAQKQQQLHQSTRRFGSSVRVPRIGPPIRESFILSRPFPIFWKDKRRHIVIKLYVFSSDLLFPR